MTNAARCPSLLLFVRFQYPHVFLPIIFAKPFPRRRKIRTFSLSLSLSPSRLLIQRDSFNRSLTVTQFAGNSRKVKKSNKKRVHDGNGAIFHPYPPLCSSRRLRRGKNGPFFITTSTTLCPRQCKKPPKNLLTFCGE
jgi:hypothetical protein